MLENMLFGKTVTPLCGKCLDAYSLRHKVIANNVANVEVSGYNRMEVKFEAELENQLNRNKFALCQTHPKHLPVGGRLNSAPGVAVDDSNPKLNAINNVDIDMEMADMAKNQLGHNLISTVMRMEYQRLRMSIRGQ
ncbi:MAG: flagellar basal body rod protein FlgB [candidate division Zixibacteria bacterium]|nr:flagellar basal body rod protein FlgB [Candidatus Tariuqbacter arcticus]